MRARALMARYAEHRDRTRKRDVMALRFALTLAALRAALTAPTAGRHRRPSWAVRAATAARERARFVIGIPDPHQRYRPVHAARRTRRPALAYGP